MYEALSYRNWPVARQSIFEPIGQNGRLRSHAERVAKLLIASWPKVACFWFYCHFSSKGVCKFTQTPSFHSCTPLEFPSYACNVSRWSVSWFWSYGGDAYWCLLLLMYFFFYQLLCFQFQKQLIKLESISKYKAHPHPHCTGRLA